MHNNYLSFGDLAQKYDLKNENELFLRCVELYLSIPEKWEEDNIPSFHFQRTPNNCLEIVKENCRDNGNIQKKVLYIYIQRVIYFQKNINVGKQTTFCLILIP